MKTANPLSQTLKQPGVIILALLVLATALFGGSSRPDVSQLIVLRPVAGLLLVAGLYFVSRNQLKQVIVPLGALIALALIMIAQLVPLPPSLWQSLPGREPIAQIGALLEMESVWRPISLVPTRTLNALASLVVPIAAIVAIAASGLSARALLVFVLLIGVADASVGILQFLGADALHFYTIGEARAATGLFSNANHSGVFSAMCLLVATVLGTDGKLGIRGTAQRALVTAAFVFILFAALTSSSRSALLLTFASLGACLVLFWNAYSSQMKFARKGRGAAFAAKLTRWIPLVVGGFLALVVAAFFYGDRLIALDALTTSEPFQDLRWQITPVLVSMMETHWLVGTGFGSFEEVYHMFEPTQLMRSEYINMAHNDWAQLVIEGGVLAVLLLAGSLFWMLKGLIGMARALGWLHGRVIFWTVIATQVALFSLVDYPLRAPLFQLVGVLLVAGFAISRFDHDDQKSQSQI